ncbi:MAG TPA: integrase, partial [Marinobacter sp.]|nr:integrase [Marinobacter sp.]
MIAADTDCEAVSAWLNETGANSRKTYDAYRREAERFLLWAAHINKSLSEVLRDDIVEYYEFIKKVPKGSPLLGSKVCRRSNPEWRPFTGSLSKNAQRNTQLILSSLYKYLTDSGWLYA